MQISNINVHSQSHTQRQKINRSQPAFGRAEFIIGMAKELKGPFKATRANRIISIFKKTFFKNKELSEAIENASDRNSVEILVFPKKKLFERRSYNAVVRNNIYGATTMMTGRRLEKGRTFNQGFVDSLKEELGKDEKYLKLLNEKYENEFPIGPRRGW